MRAFSTSLAFLASAQLVYGDLHQLIVGTFGTKFLYTIEFDDVALTLNLLKNTSVTASSSWISLSHDKKNLYGVSTTSDNAPAYVSYALGNATAITESKTLGIGGNCNSSKAIFVISSPESPYNVYGTPFGGGDAGCGSVMSVDDTGALSEVIQNYTYYNTSGVHGMAFNNDSSFLYSADDGGNTLWTHSVDSTTGEVTEVNALAGPVTGSDPRHVTVHPEGKYLYVILEGSNQVAQYSIDQSTGIPSFENVTYPLIPSNATSSEYWSDEVALSFSNNYLWATSRARSKTAKGYISAFSLADDGAITEQLFLLPTTTSGGTSNSVAPSSFSDEFVAIADNSGKFVEIWSLANGTAGVVAHLDLNDGGCCANAVWYS